MSSIRILPNFQLIQSFGKQSGSSYLLCLNCLLRGQTCKHRKCSLPLKQSCISLHKIEGQSLMCNLVDMTKCLGKDPVCTLAHCDLVACGNPFSKLEIPCISQGVMEASPAEAQVKIQSDKTNSNIFMDSFPHKLISAFPDVALPQSTVCLLGGKHVDATSRETGGFTVSTGKKTLPGEQKVSMKLLDGASGIGPESDFQIELESLPRSSPAEKMKPRENGNCNKTEGIKFKRNFCDTKMIQIIAGLRSLGNIGSLNDKLDYKSHETESHVERGTVSTSPTSTKMKEQSKTCGTTESGKTGKVLEAKDSAELAPFVVFARTPSRLQDKLTCRLHLQQTSRELIPYCKLGGVTNHLSGAKKRKRNWIRHVQQSLETEQHNGMEGNNGNQMECAVNLLRKKGCDVPWWGNATQDARTNEGKGRQLCQAETVVVEANKIAMNGNRKYVNCLTSDEEGLQVNERAIDAGEKVRSLHKIGVVFGYLLESGNALRKGERQVYMDKAIAEEKGSRQPHMDILNDGRENERQPHVKKSMMGSPNPRGANCNFQRSINIVKRQHSILREWKRFSIMSSLKDCLTTKDMLPATMPAVVRAAADFKETNTPCIVSSFRIKKIVKAVSCNSRMIDGQQEVVLLFKALRSDGKEVLVNNEFMRSSYPHLLLNFYEENLRFGGLVQK